jgi:hypothetical protein
MKRIRFFLPVFILLFSWPAFAGKGEINFVETAVDLRPDGVAVVVYTVQWKVLSGELHGFYFQGNDRLKVRMVAEDGYAVDSRGNRYRLSIKPVDGDTWDIILAGGAGVSSGEVTYVFYFLTDFAEAGYLAPTLSADSSALMVFNWAPVQWDEAHSQRHYTLTVLTPHILPEGENPRDYVNRERNVLTESWVNEAYKIDYQRGADNRLLLLFHKENPATAFTCGCNATSRRVGSACRKGPPHRKLPTNTPTKRLPKLPVPPPRSGSFWEAAFFC